MKEAADFYAKRGFVEIPALPRDMPQLPDDRFMMFEF
jgi:hypothetical protein